MINLEGKDLRQHIERELEGIRHRRDFAETLTNDYILRDNTRRGVLVTGLRSTGKTKGVLQAVSAFPSDNIVYISPESRAETTTKSQVLDILKQKDYDLVFVDEYSWLKDEADGKDMLADYLAGKASSGVKVVITGTDSTKINSLLNTDFIHRAVELSTTYFSYDEYCRLFELDKNDETLKDFLQKGGVFESHIHKSFGSMRDYIKNAIVENLASYYPWYDKELVEATVYKIFYECICKNYTKSAESVPIYNRPGKNAMLYEDFLENFGINTSTAIPRPVLNEIFSKLGEIGVVVSLPDIKLKGRERAYITNQSISAQLVKCIYELDYLPEAYLGDLFEATVVCYEYFNNPRC